jgi:S1-C subfamily serine protease
MADLSNRCPRCGQPFLLGVCGLCGTRQDEAMSEAAPVVSPEGAQPQVAATATPELQEPEPTASGSPPFHPAYVTRSPPRPAVVAEPPAQNTGGLSPALFSVVVVMLVLSLIVSGYLVVTMAGVRSKVNETRDAQSAASDRITAVEGDIRAVTSDQSELRDQLKAQAAADPVVVASRVQPSVYTIATDFGLGSGWVASFDGVHSRFVTNYHVIADAFERGVNTVKVFQDQGAQLDGTIEQADAFNDLAVISVEAQIPVLKQSTETAQPGEQILVVGSPLGLGGSVSTGSVAALRDLGGVNYLQFTAPISPGNSGGPVVNLAGEVIGITEAKIVAQGSEGIGFAIPVSQVCTQLKIC